jgi:p-aminobenzoyl-glutamate transporter AbgT
MTSSGLLAGIERLGNRLPDPSTLFLVGTLLVLALSQLAVSCGWTVEKEVLEEVRVEVRDAAGAPVIDPATHAPLTIAAIDPATVDTRRRCGVPRPMEVRALAPQLEVLALVLGAGAAQEGPLSGNPHRRT